MTTTNTTLTDLFGAPISVYTRAQAIADGELVDVTKWASAGPEGMMGGFKVPVALTRSLWAAIEAIPKSLDGLADVRGRAHDVLWMASLAARAVGGDQSRRNFVVIMPRRGSRKRNTILTVDIGPGDDHEPVVTIGFPEDF
jgi:hypothetical protein